MPPLLLIVLGSNRFNLTLALGAAALVAVTALIRPVLHTGRVVTRSQGLLLITGYGVYLAYLLG
jgi:Ca2+/Na+ antiporter